MNFLLNYQNITFYHEEDIFKVCILLLLNSFKLGSYIDLFNIFIKYNIVNNFYI